MTTTPIRMPAERVAAAAEYAPRRPLALVDLALAGTEGAGDPFPSDVATAAAAAASSRYPDSTPLRTAIASAFGVGSEQVVVTAGADDALERAFRAYLEPGREALLTTPTFEMLPRFVRMVDAAAISVPWPDSGFPLAAILAAVTPRTALIAVVSPNNPTGSVASLAELTAIHDAAPGAILVVDHAYIEYADSDPTEALLQLPRVVVIRTFSKAWGLAGARIGYALGAADVVGSVASAGNPYPVAAPSLALALHALKHGRDRMTERVSATRTRREQIGDAFAAVGIALAPTQANFVCAHPANARWMWDALVGLGIGTRLIEDPTPSRVRVTVPATVADCDRVRIALQVITRPQALILDMDGVIADVSRSYRAAIIGAAASFGVSVTADDIAAIKRRGNANDDWEVTASLVAARHPHVTYAEARDAFEALYQGTGGQPGLRDDESLLTSSDTLRRLAARLPLAIATGRPAGDARRFLAVHDIGACFSACITREAGPVKPDPFVAHEAMRQLGIGRAWMVGDTPDDIRAARAAGVLPLGILAPGDGDAMHDALMRAGAARVLATLEDLEELLP